ncbi:hypothetical protein NDU88_007549 [Pleurodeles waltl]|uniref:Uncharacterized protein n=1 Tax=Pleurodeles waltl TaxID=8319 RepID=A0AAV7N679_PLEWA|nr:hypothetical protein NDU88_007549 [Pleurodeles waltl]
MTSWAGLARARCLDQGALTTTRPHCLPVFFLLVSSFPGFVRAAVEACEGDNVSSPAHLYGFELSSPVPSYSLWRLLWGFWAARGLFTGVCLIYWSVRSGCMWFWAMAEKRSRTEEVLET